jgi:uncharacterized MnhB-related membrane protein
VNAPKHWQDPVNACVGVVILMSPWLADYALVQPALANAVIAGTILFTVSVAAAVIGRPWVEWAVVAVGAWLLAAPWALALTDERSRLASLVMGGLVLALGAWALGQELLGRGRSGVRMSG